VKEGLAGVAVLGAAAVALVGWRRRQPVVAALGTMSVVGPVVAVWSGTRITGEVFPYLLVWASSLLLPGAIGAGWLLLSRPVEAPVARPRPTRLPPGRFVAATAVMVGIVLTWTMARRSLIPYPPSTDVVGVARAAEPWLTDHHVREVRIRIAQHDQWPLASGVALRLEKDGVRATVDAEWTPVFGDHFKPTRHEQASIWVADAGSGAPAGSAATLLGTVGGAAAWAGPRPSAGPG
jgi:hypothetical protein